MTGSGVVVVLGGINLDLKARSAKPLARGTSHPGTAHSAPGGVGRNIAENLARLGQPVELIGRVGDDAAGATVLAATRQAGVGTGWVSSGAEPTGVYTAIFDPDGELFAGVAAMTATEALTPELAAPALTALLPSAAMLVLDGNLRTDTLAHALDRARDAAVPVVLDPVSAPKAAAIRPVLDGSRPVHTITPDLHELDALADGRDAAAVARLHHRGVDTVWVSQGAQGSWLCPAQGPARQIGTRAVTTVEVTGAGDALVAGYVHGLVRGLDPAEAAALGTRAALVTVQSAHSVRPDLVEAMAQADLGPAREEK